MARMSDLFVEKLKDAKMHNIDVHEIREGVVLVILPVSGRAAKFTVSFAFENENNKVAVQARDYLKVTEDQFPAALICCNQLNADYRWLKFYINEDNQVIAENDMIIDEESGISEVFEIFLRLVTILDEAYPKLNKAIWA